MAIASPSPDYQLPSRRWSPSEGWSTLLLHLALMAVAVYPLSQIRTFESTGALIALALAGVITGWILSKLGIPTWLAIPIALVGGVLLVITVSVWLQIRSGESASAAFDSFITSVGQIPDQLNNHDGLDDLQASVLAGMLLWVIGFSSSWLLYSSGLLGASLSLPTSILIASLIVETDSGSGAALAFVVLALLISARFTAFKRFSYWRDRGYDAPAAPSLRFFLVGSVIAVLSFAAVQALSMESSQQKAESAFDTAADYVNKQVDRLEGYTPFDKDSPPPSSFAAFGSDFSVDGSINLSDEPAVVVRGSKPEYLAARRLDIYNGTDWTSSSAQLIDDDPQYGGAGALVTFQPNQPMNLSRDQLNDRQQNQTEVQPLVDMGGVILTIDSHYAADPATKVSMRWMSLDEQYDLSNLDANSVPPELQRLIALLQGATFTGDDSSGPLIDEVAVQNRVAAEQQRLVDTYPITTALIWGDNGPVLIAKGKIPVYDDVQAVYDNSGRSGTAAYVVTGVVSSADDNALSQAGTDYPWFVTSVDLQLPDSLPQRVRDLAQEVTAGTTSQFEAAIAIQSFLRTSYDYQLNVPSPPDGADAVDYFLFERQEGRCTHFASAMTVLMRSLGYPSRIVAGYAPGQWSTAAGGYVSRFSSAHTWVETYIPGYGWIPFEPTPSQTALDYEGNADTVVTPTPEALPSATVGPEATEVATQPVATPVAAASTDNSEPGTYNDVDLKVVLPLVLLGLLALLVTLAMAAWRRGVRGLDSEAALYSKSMRIGQFLGIRGNPSTTPSEYAARFGEAIPAAKAPINTITSAYEDRLYGPEGTTSISPRDLGTAWRQVRRNVWKWRPWRDFTAGSGDRR